MAVYYTRRAASKLQDIEEYTLRNWGENQADSYMLDLDIAVEEIDPRTRSRRHRADPFHMIPAGEHFMIYDIFDDDIYVVEVFGQMQDIETRIAEAIEEIREDLMNLREQIKARGA